MRKNLSESAVFRIFIWIAFGLTLVCKVGILFLFDSWTLRQASDRAEVVDDTSFFLDPFLVVKIATWPIQAVGASPAFSLSLVSMAIWLGLFFYMVRKLKVFNLNKTVVGLLFMFFLFSPAINLFSVVALRDFFLFGLIVVFVAMAHGMIFAPFQLYKLAGFLLVSVCGVLTRPETISVFLTVLTLLFFLKTKKRTLTFLLLVPIILMVVWVLSGWVLNYSFNGNFESVSDALFAIRDSRYDRQFKGVGGGSSFVDQWDWQSMDNLSKSAVQIFSFFIGPVSKFSIAGVGYFIDSCCLGISAMCVFSMSRNKVFNPGSCACLLAVLICGIAISQLTVNYGNAFRMRLMIWAVLVGYLVAVLAKVRVEKIREIR